MRADRGTWHAKIGGKLVNLDAPKWEQGRPFAQADFERLVADLVAGQVQKVVGVIAPQTATSATGGAVKAGTVAELIPRYLDAADLMPHTRLAYTSRLAWLGRHFGAVPVATLDADAVSAVARSETWAPNTRRQTLVVCQVFAGWCGLAGWVCRKPAPESRGDEAVVSREEYVALCAVARGDFRPLLKFLWLTGCRPGEACRLTADQVDWTNGTATLKLHKTSRKGKRRVIFLADEAMNVLVAQRAKHTTGHLFRGIMDKPFTPDMVSVRMATAVKLSGVREEITAYGLRHTYITRMLEAGVPESDVAALVGHSGSAMISKVYSHVTANARRLKEVAGRVSG